MRSNRIIIYVCRFCGRDILAKRADRPRIFCSQKCNGASRKLTPEQILAAALTKLDYSDPRGCRVWTGAKRNEHGYGGIWDGIKWTYAHRFFYERLVGPIPDGLDILHHCDNPPCCFADPDPLISHLFAGTHKENCDDREAKGRGLKGRTVPIEHRKQGTKHGMAKLTEALVVTIRARHAAGGISQAQLGREYGVSQKTINDVVLMRCWKHVP